ncbi:MAG TPA: alpha/beta fold hydrolase [Chloroflexia bacterium]|nr:alpha/beta fold hydrolase [Chloroflexia bacterium]
MSNISFRPKKPFYKTWKFLILVVLVILLIYPVVSIVGSFRQTLVYNRSIGFSTPADEGLSFENISFQSPASDHATMRGWWIPNNKSGRALILLHGQNNNRDEYLPFAKTMWNNGYSILMYDMRGHGQSDGFTHSYGEYEQVDVLGAVDFLKQRGIKPASIGIFGRSMGGAVAIMAMSQTSEIAAGISDSGFANWAERERKRLFLFYPGVELACKVLQNFDIQSVQPVKSIQSVNRPILLIQGEDDTVVPVQDAYDLKQAGGSNVELWLVPGAGHVQAELKQPEEYWRRVQSFFNTNLARY